MPGALQEEQGPGWECWDKVLAVKIMQNCLNPGPFYHGVDLEAVGMRTVLIQEVHMLWAAQGLIWACEQNSATEMQRFQLTILLCSWLASRGREGTESTTNLNKMSFFIWGNAGHS